MTHIAVHTGDAPEIEGFLAQRIYEYNAATTGYRDGESFSATRQDESGVIEAGICGYTWGGCCFITHLWVSESLRGRGIGTELLGAAERHAHSKGCSLALLASHSFQAPAFYIRRGYEPAGRIENHPPGYANIFFVKRLNA
jgi:GNAT superfamily N-acetyltransferase